MNCNKFHEEISAFLDGELGEEEKLRVQKHMESCPKCKEEYELNIALHNAVADARDAFLPPEFLDGVMERLHRPRLIDVWRRYNTAAALAVAAVALVIFAYGATEKTNFITGSIKPPEATEHPQVSFHAGGKEEEITPSPAPSQEPEYRLSDTTKNSAAANAENTSAPKKENGDEKISAPAQDGNEAAPAQDSNEAAAEETEGFEEVAKTVDEPEARMFFAVEPPEQTPLPGESVPPETNSQFSASDTLPKTISGGTGDATGVASPKKDSFGLGGNPAPAGGAATAAVSGIDYVMSYSLPSKECFDSEDAYNEFEARLSKIKVRLTETSDEAEINSIVQEFYSLTEEIENAVR